MIALGAVIIASVTGVSAHIVRGLVNPTLATAFVSSPSAGTDAPIKVVWATQDSGLRVICFNAANTSPPRPDDANWPRATAIGFELPGALSGFSLLEPLGDEWKLVEGIEAAIPGRGTVTLDFALLARVSLVDRLREGARDPGGVPPGQPATRGSGTRFCVSGPFPDMFPNLADPTQSVPATIEQIINGVVVRFQRVQPHVLSTDVGLWENPLRSIPLYPE